MSQKDENVRVVSYLPPALHARVKAHDDRHLRLGMSSFIRVAVDEYLKNNPVGAHPDTNLCTQSRAA